MTEHKILMLISARGYGCFWELPVSRQACIRRYSYRRRAGFLRGGIRRLRHTADGHITLALSRAQLRSGQCVDSLFHGGMQSRISALLPRPGCCAGAAALPPAEPRSRGTLIPRKCSTLQQ